MPLDLALVIEAVDPMGKGEVVDLVEADGRGTRIPSYWQVQSDKSKFQAIARINRNPGDRKGGDE